MSRILLLIPDGVGVRNFLIGNFPRQLRDKGEVCIAHVIPPYLLSTYRAGFSNETQWEPLLDYKESPVSFTLRYALNDAQMFWADTRAMRYTRNRAVKGSWRTKTVHRLAKAIGQRAASPPGIRVLDFLHCLEVKRLPEVKHYQKLFEKIRPSALFCSHQRPPVILPAVLAAKSLGIPTTTFIFSWDNLTSKGRIAAPFDHYLVWSDSMRLELIRYYPDISKDRVHIVGTPQFDFYADENLLWSREDFFRRVHADPSRPLICYSGGDTGTAPEDPGHVRVLMELIRSGKIKNRPQVLMRPAPVDGGRRYEEVRREYPELIYAKPDWADTQPQDWSRVIPLPEDVQFLANLVRYADMNINLASTMTLDFAIHDKPVVNLAFDIADPPPFGVPLWDFYYQFEHYRPVVDLKAARFARSAEELARHINDYLQDPSLDRENRKRLVNLEVDMPLGRSAEQIISVLNKSAL